MKIKNKEPEFLIGVPDGSIEYMQASQADEWINIWEDGTTGCYGHTRIPTDEERLDIEKRIIKLQELTNEKQRQLIVALKIMKNYE